MSLTVGCTGRVSAVCVVDRLHQDPGSVGVTAIDKRPLQEPVKVTSMGLYGDVQADRVHHGGLDKAVYAFSESETRYWEKELARVVAPGFFGENLSIANLDVDNLEFGSQITIGSARFEVTAPRIPCATFARWLAEDKWVKTFTDHGRPGVYLRVAQTGQLTVDDTVEVLSVPGHGITVGDWFAEPTAEKSQRVLASAESGTWNLAPKMRDKLEKSLRSSK